MDIPHNIDFNYIFTHSDTTKFQIPSCYDREIWTPGETYNIRVSNIYDPSKFWIVLKHKELDIFQNFITNFYQKNCEYYRTNVQMLSKNMYCVGCVNGTFYRGIIVNIPPSPVLEKRAAVFLIDFGEVLMIKLEDLFYLAEKFYQVPQFSIRASLAYVRPFDKYTWDVNAVKKFTELVSNRVLLCILEHADPTRKIVEITIGQVDELSSIVDVGNILVKEKIARSLPTKKETAANEDKVVGRYVHKTKYPYLFPSFEAIEGGFVPSTVYVTEMLQQCVVKDVLFKPYFMYKGIPQKNI